MQERVALTQSMPQSVHKMTLYPRRKQACYGVSLLESRPDVIGLTKRNMIKTIKLYNYIPYNGSQRWKTGVIQWPFGVRMRRLGSQPPHGTNMGSHPSVLAPGPLG